MSPNQVEQVFASFAQADASTTRQYGGTGLGLTITRSFCQMMGGDITVKSQAGVGSTFTMILRRRLDKEPAIHATSTTEQDLNHTSDHQGNGRVLVIDDDATVRDYLQRALGRYGY